MAGFGARRGRTNGLPETRKRGERTEVLKPTTRRAHKAVDTCAVQHTAYLDPSSRKNLLWNCSDFAHFIVPIKLKIPELQLVCTTFHRLLNGGVSVSLKVLSWRFASGVPAQLSWWSLPFENIDIATTFNKRFPRTSDVCHLSDRLFTRVWISRYFYNIVPHPSQTHVHSRVRTSTPVHARKRTYIR